MICPYKYKYELVHYLVRYQGWLYSNAMKLKKKQLYAIWYKNSEDKLCKKCSKCYLSCNCILHPATIYNRKHIMKERK